MKFNVGDTVLVTMEGKLNNKIGIIRVINEVYLGVEFSFLEKGCNLYGKINNNNGFWFKSNQIVKMIPLKKICDKKIYDR